jgi:hypothetical protein
VNADNAGLRCEKFTHIKMRAKNGALKELALNCSTKLTLDNCGNGLNSVAQKFGLFNFGSIKHKKTRSKSLQMFSSLLTENDEKIAVSLFQLMGAVFWDIQLIEDFQYSLSKSCYFGISKQYILAVDAARKSILFVIGSNAVIGWTLNENENSFLLYFDIGECVCVKFKTNSEMQQCLRRLEYFTRGCKVSF